MTLFPREKSKGWQKADKAPKEIPARRKKKPEQDKKVYLAVSYRLPQSLHNNLCGLAMDLAVPVGEVIVLLLRHGLEAYQAGKLSLNPMPLTVKMTLHGNGQ